MTGDSKSMVCKVKKSLYGLKQSPRLWYHKLHRIINSFDFVMNHVDKCIYHKFSGSKFMFLILNVDDILLATNDLNLLRDAKKFMSKKL